MKNKLLWTMNVHKSSQLKLQSDFSENMCKWVTFQKSCITCNFSGKLPHKYLSRNLTRVSCTTLFQYTSLSEQFYVNVVISTYAISTKSHKEGIKLNSEFTSFSLHDVNLQILLCCLKENEKYFTAKLIAKFIFTSDSKPYKQKNKQWVKLQA